MKNENLRSEFEFTGSGSCCGFTGCHPWSMIYKIWKFQMWLNIWTQIKGWKWVMYVSRLAVIHSTSLNFVQFFWLGAIQPHSTIPTALYSAKQPPTAQCSYWTIHTSNFWKHSKTSVDFSDCLDAFNFHSYGNTWIILNKSFCICIYLHFMALARKGGTRTNRVQLTHPWLWIYQKRNLIAMCIRSTIIIIIFNSWLQK